MLDLRRSKLHPVFPNVPRECRTGELVLLLLYEKGPPTESVHSIQFTKIESEQMPSNGSQPKKQQGMQSKSGADIAIEQRDREVNVDDGEDQETNYDTSISHFAGFKKFRRAAKLLLRQRVLASKY